MESQTILRFCDVSFRSESLHAADIWKISMALTAGELALVLLDGHSDDTPFCDLAEGLLEPQEGSVEFLGERWSDMSRSSQSDARGTISRVFKGQGWVSNLTVYDNIVLSQRHHTVRSEHDINQQVERLARNAGILTVPEQLPDSVSFADLKRAEWIRAFMGAPRLVLLEQPEQGMPEDGVASLVNMVLAVMNAGAAVIWLTTSRSFWNDKRLTTARRSSIEKGVWTTQPTSEVQA